MIDTLTVVIVAQDSTTRRALTKRLQQAGCRVNPVPGTEEARHLARTAAPDVVLVDPALRDEQVGELCRELRTSSELTDIPIILFSETGAASQAEARAHRLGADGTVPWPTGDDDLLARLHAYVPGLDPAMRLTAQPDYESIVEDAPIGMYRTTPEGEIVMANQALLDMLGYESFDELAERDLESAGYHPDYARSNFKEQMEKDGRVRGLAAAWRRKDGSTLQIRESARAVRGESGPIVAYEGSIEDITESVERLRRLKRLNAILDAIRDVNQLIVRVKEPTHLVDRACQLLVETRGYRTAWIALMDDGAPRHVAQAGFDQLPDAVIDALSDGELQMCGTDALSLPGLCLTSDPTDGRLAALYAGERLMAIRLQHGGTVYGLMSVSLPPDVDVDQQEQALFEEVAGDIAFALHSIDLEEQRAATAQALHDHQANLSALIENTDGSIWSLDRAYRLIIGNSVFHRNVRDSLGRTLAQGQDVLAVDNGLAPTTEEWRDYYERALAGEQFSIEAERHVEAGPRYVEYRFNPIRAADGAVVGATVYGRDVTERRRAAEEIRDRSARLEAVRDVGLRITAELDLEPLLRSIATRATELLHSTGGGLYLVQAQGHDEVLEWRVPVGSALEPGQTTLRRGEGLAGTVWERGEALVVDDYQAWEGRSEAWGTYGLHAAVAAPVRWGDTILGVLSLHTDAPGAYSRADARLLDLFADQAAIAIRNARLYEETRQLASFNDDILRSMAEGIILEDADGVLTFVNPAAAELLGYQPDDLLDRRREAIVPPDQRPILETVNEAVEQGARELFQLELTQKDGARIPVLVSSAPRFDVEGQFIGTLIVFNDVTKQREAEQELASRADHLRAINDLAVDLASAASMDACFRLVAERLKAMTGSPFVAVSSYDSDEQKLVVRHFVGEGRVIARATRYLDRAIAGWETQLDNKAVSQILEEGVGIRNSLAETTFGAVPKPVAGIIQKALGIDHFTGVALSDRGQLLGTAIVVSKEAATRPSAEVLHVFGRVAAASLRRRQAEEAVRESEAFLREVIDTSPNCIFVKDYDGRYILVNQTIADLYSISVEGMLGKTDRELAGAERLSYEEAEQFLADDREVIDTGRPKLVREEPFTTAERTIRWFQTVKVPITSGWAGRAMLGVAADITERKRVEEALRESETFLRQIIDASPNLIFVKDHESKYVLANKAVADLYGVSVEEMLGQTDRDLAGADRLSHEEAEHFLADDREVLETRQPKVVRQESLTTPDGGTRWFQTVKVPIRSGRAAPAMLGVSADITQRKVMEEALRESEERFRVVLENLPGGVFAHDLNGNLVLVNDAASRNTGYSRAELLQMTVADIDAASIPRGDAEKLWHTLDSGGAASLETAHLRKDGSTYPADVRLSAVTLGGQPVILAVAFDISERKRAEEALKESEERFRALIESAPVSILLLRKGRYIYGNPAGADLLGYESAEEIVGLDPMETIAPESQDMIRERMARVADSQDNKPVELKLVTPAGEVHWVISTSVSIQMDGQPAAVIVGQDITERKRAEEELRRLGAAVEQSTEGFLFADMDGHILYANRAVEELYGHEPEDVIGEPIFSLAAPAADTGLIEEHLMSSGSWMGEVEQLRRDGSTFPALLSVFTLTDGNDSVDSIVASIRDVTEEQRMEEQLRQQERLAAVGQLAGGIAHDFNNILAAILLYAEMPLNDPRTSPATRDALTTILEESHRAADLVQQILDFSRSAMMDTESLDLVGLVEEAAGLLRRTIPENIDLIVDAPTGACTVQADATRIHQALMNLALNAKDAMPQGGELRVVVDSIQISDRDEVFLEGMEPGEWARMTVSDDGTGMTEEVQDHLFEPFFTTKEQGKGTGLGLAQVYGIVKQHKGFIDVETAPGEGTTVTIFLPAEDASTAGTAEQTSGAGQGRGETILVVEDAEGLRGAIEAGLASFGYRVLTAAHGRQALDVATEERIDLVLTDVIMPEMGGEALLRRLRRAHPDLRVVAMTGHMMDQDVHRLRASGFSAALPKPFSIEELTDIVRSVLDASRP